ncbi:MAG TPA: DUF3788 family protein [Prolixibacteraceae bacterium]|nr:DUF3788 family protein [Prolixibacteraceae bacterium]HPR59385.1 DUF3788 family protein [Prolixibacteraceae bacterium]
MAASIYTEKMVQPNEQMLIADLAATKKIFDELAWYIEKKYGAYKPEWKFYSQKSGWIMKMYSKKRNVLFVIPCNGFFRVSFTFGEKAFEQILLGNFSEFVKRLLLEAPKYAEGRSIMLEVKNEDDFDTVVNLIDVKMLN